MTSSTNVVDGCTLATPCIGVQRARFSLQTHLSVAELPWRGLCGAEPENPAYPAQLAVHDAAQSTKAEQSTTPSAHVIQIFVYVRDIPHAP